MTSVESTFQVQVVLPHQFVADAAMVYLARNARVVIVKLKAFHLLSLRNVRGLEWIANFQRGQFLTRL